MIRLSFPRLLFAASQSGLAFAASIFLIFDIRQQMFVVALSASAMVCAVLYVAARRAVLSFLALFVFAYVSLFLISPVVAQSSLLNLPQGRPLQQYMFLTIVGLTLFLLTYDLCSPRTLHLEVVRPRQDTTWRTAILFTLPLIIAVLLLIFDGHTLASLTSASRLSLKQEASWLTLTAQYLWAAGSVGVVLLPLGGQRFRLDLLLSLPLLLVLGTVGFLAFRTRSALVFLGGAILTGHWLKRELQRMRAPAGTKAVRIRSPRTIVVILVVMVGGAGGSYLRFARGAYEQQGVEGLLDVNLRNAVALNLVQGDLGYATTVMDVLAFVPAKADHLAGQSYYRLLFTPIPRSVWPQKPENTQRVVARWLAPGRPEQTIPPGIQGDLFLNFGLPGVVGFIAFGVAFAWLDRIPGWTRVLGIGAGVVPVFHLVRGGFTSPLLLLLVVLTSSWFASETLEWRARRLEGTLPIPTGTTAR